MTDPQGVDASDGDSAALVFVYGSLKRGQPGHHWLNGSRCCGEAWLPGLALYDLGPFPMAVASDDPRACLQGELYRVSAPQLARLDRFEGVPRLYERQLRPLGDGRTAWVYVGRPRQVRHVARIASGVWQGRRRNLLALAMLLVPLLPCGAAAQAGDLRRDCLEWSRSHGREKVAIANRIGRDNLLTKERQFAEAQPDDTTSLYRWSDIQLLCRRQ
jgi:gamma-glutamylcyclotransferase (GGCT)/AIG2-like uncharacterized protein YtfP